MDQYIDQIQDDYPHLSREELRIILRSEFEAVHTEISSGRLKTIRLKYFGIFTVFKKRATGALKKLHERFADGKMDHAEFLIRKENLESKIQSYEKDA